MIRFSHRPTPSYPIKRTNTYHYPTPSNTLTEPIETPDEPPQPKPLTRSKTIPPKKPKGRPKKVSTVSNTSTSSTDIHTGQPSELTQHDTNTPQDY